MSICRKSLLILFKEPIFCSPYLKKWMYGISRWKAGEGFFMSYKFPCHGLLMWYCLSFQTGDLWSGCVDKSWVFVWSVLPQRVPTKSASTTSQLATVSLPTVWATVAIMGTQSLKKRLAVKVGCIWQLAFQPINKNIIFLKKLDINEFPGSQIWSQWHPGDTKTNAWPHTGWISIDWVIHWFIHSIIDCLLIQKFLNNPMFGTAVNSPNGKAKTAHFIELQ